MSSGHRFNLGKCRQIKMFPFPMFHLNPQHDPKHMTTLDEMIRKEENRADGFFCAPLYLNKPCVKRGAGDDSMYLEFGGRKKDRDTFEVSQNVAARRSSLNVLAPQAYQ
jgi:hypothetical protein